MSLDALARLGPYEILGPLDAGGMGEVYRAKDTRLGRDVAVKILPASLVLPVGTTLDSDNASIALSPDGTKLVYAAVAETGAVKLWLRPLSSLVAQPLPGTDGALELSTK